MGWRLDDGADGSPPPVSTASHILFNNFNILTVEKALKGSAKAPRAEQLRIAKHGNGATTHAHRDRGDCISQTRSLHAMKIMGTGRAAGSARTSNVVQ